MLSLSLTPVYPTNNQTSYQQPFSAIVLPLQVLVILRLRELHRGVLPQEPLHALDAHLLVEIDPFRLLLPVLRPRIEPNRREVRDLRRLVRELVAIDEGLVEREILHFLIVLREREEVQLRLDALLASLRVDSLPSLLPRPRRAPSRPWRGSERRVPTSAARFSTLDPSSHRYVAVRVVVDRLGHALRHVQTHQRVVEAQRLLQEAENVLRHQLARKQIFPRQAVLHLVVLR